MNPWIALMLLVPITLLILWQWAALRRARRSEGQPAPDTSAVDRGCRNAERVYYFFATHCGPCRAVRPLVERLGREYPNLIAVDVERHPELAHGFGIAATPSFIAVADGRIRGVRLGAPAESWLRERLAPTPSAPCPTQS